MNFNKLGDLIKAREKPLTIPLYQRSAWLELNANEETRLEEEWFCSVCKYILAEQYPGVMKAVAAREMSFGLGH